jgi:hypothetical protein
VSAGAGGGGDGSGEVGFPDELGFAVGPPDELGFAVEPDLSDELGFAVEPPAPFELPPALAALAAVRSVSVSEGGGGFVTLVPVLISPAPRPTLLYGEVPLSSPAGPGPETSTSTAPPAAAPPEFGDAAPLGPAPLLPL